MSALSSSQPSLVPWLHTAGRCRVLPRRGLVVGGFGPGTVAPLAAPRQVIDYSETARGHDVWFPIDNKRTPSDGWSVKKRGVGSLAAPFSAVCGCLYHEMKRAPWAKLPKDAPCVPE